MCHPDVLGLFLQWRRTSRTYPLLLEKCESSGGASRVLPGQLDRFGGD